MDVDTTVDGGGHHMRWRCSPNADQHAVIVCGMCRMLPFVLIRLETSRILKYGPKAHFFTLERNERARKNSFRSVPADGIGLTHALTQEPGMIQARAICTDRHIYITRHSMNRSRQANAWCILMYRHVPTPEGEAGVFRWAFD